MNWIDHEKENDGISSEKEGLGTRERAFTKVMIESLPGSFSISDANGRLVWWNTYHQKELVGKDDREMFSTNALEVFHPDDRAFVLEKMLNVLNLGIEETGEGRVLVLGGPKFQWRMITGKRIIIDAEPFVVAVGIDITERKRLEAITSFRLLLHNIIETASLEELLKVSIDEVKRLTQSSTGFFHLVAEDKPTFIMQVCSSDTPILEREQHNTPFLNETEILADAILLKEAIIDNNYETSTMHGATPDSDTIKRILFIPLKRGSAVAALLCVGGKSYDYDKDDLTMVGTLANFAWDIISRKRAELSEQKIQKLLFQSQKMELVGQLAGGIAQDFNNMLGVIHGNAKIAMNKEATDGALLGNMKAILQAAAHSSNLCNQLLAFSRNQCVMPIVLDLNTMVERGLAILKRFIGKNITLAWIPDTHTIPIKIDPEQIELILGNLCVNSRDAIYGRGEITIETGRIHVEKAECAAGHPCKEPGDYAVLSVTDNGVGIEAKHIPFIFEPFFTTKEKRQGTGMGLTTVYGIIKQNGAFIECSSEQGSGTTFRIYFPQHAGYADQEKSDQFTPSIDYSKKLILLVEDEPDILSIYKLMLESYGYLVLDARSPKTALRIADEHREHIQLLITDVVLPDMNGCDLSRKIQLTSPQLKTLFISGYATETVTDQEMAELEVNFIQKPFSIKELFVAVRKIHGDP